MSRNSVQNGSEYLGLSLWISSHKLTPEEITQLVGLGPTYTRHRGALIPGSDRLRRPEFDVHEWQFRRQLDLKRGTYLGQHIDTFITDFLSTLKPRMAEIKAVSRNHNVAVAFVFHVAELPYLGMSHEQIEVIAMLGAKVDYDLFGRNIGSEEPDELGAGE